MGTYRKRFNSKARAGQIAKQNELKRVRNKQFFRDLENEPEESTGRCEPLESPNDPNREILAPLTGEEKELKKRKLAELFTPTDTKISRLKKKRLDKFIEHQLKREEKRVLIDKLQDYKIDTSILTSSKRLGLGKQTKKEEFAEALKLEREGRGDDHTKEILYEEHEVMQWESKGDESADGESMQKGAFVDNRPAKFGGSGIGFGFANVNVVKKSRQGAKKRYNWKERVQMEEGRRLKLDEEGDFDSSTSESDEEASENEEEVARDLDLDEGSVSENVESESLNGSESDRDQQSTAADEFKNWANNQIKELEGRTVSLETPKLNFEYKPVVRPEDMEDGLHEDIVPLDTNSKRKALYVKIERAPEIQESRMRLPVFGEEQRIMEAIHHNDVVLVCGETGSGKTTQIPQFLYESGYGNLESSESPGMIGVTQPRRVAAMSMAQRVAVELGDNGSKVGYQIRFDTSLSDETRLKFMTDGVLLREMMKDFKLLKYSAIIIDEAHERNINTDILIGMLSRCVNLRAKLNAENPDTCKKLKLIIMSATLRVSDFSENPKLFKVPPPILKVDARQFPVSIHFNKRTPFNYIDEAFKKTCKIHRRLPRGAILVFLTGRQEITDMVKRLRKEFPLPKDRSTKEKNGDLDVISRADAKHVDLEAEDIEFSVGVFDQSKEEESLDESDDEGFEETLEDGQKADDPLYVLPLYSLLPTKEQMKVFQEPPAGSRLCVIATNVAETSLTIPNVRYVVDCGRSKERKYNKKNGVQSFEIDWVSKASAGQRSGRAGRTGPGHCYRLYSSAVYENDFQQFSRPEILRMPVESVVLQMKAMAINNIMNFPFPTLPEKALLSNAIKLLEYLGALDEKEKITPDGQKMSFFPLSPRFSKMLLVGNERGCLPYVVSIVSALSVGDPFLNEQELGSLSSDIDDEVESVKNGAAGRRAQYHKTQMRFSKLDKISDVFKVMSAVNALDHVSPAKTEAFLKNNFLRPKMMDEIKNLRRQLLYIVKANTCPESIGVTVTDSDLKSGVPDADQIKLLKQMICAGFIDHVAVRADQIVPDEVRIGNNSKITSIPYLPVLAPKSHEIQESFVFIHPGSIISSAGELPPKYIVYSSLQLSADPERAKTRMKPLCDIKSTPLANIARKSSLLTYSKPLSGQGLKAIAINSNERLCYVVPRFGATVDSDLKIGWNLNPIAVHQKKEASKWLVTKIITGKEYKALETQRR